MQSINKLISFGIIVSLLTVLSGSVLAEDTFVAPKKVSCTAATVNAWRSYTELYATKKQEALNASRAKLFVSLADSRQKAANDLKAARAAEDKTFNETQDQIINSKTGDAKIAADQYKTDLATATSTLREKVDKAVGVYNDGVAVLDGVNYIARYNGDPMPPKNVYTITSGALKERFDKVDQALATRGASYYKAMGNYTKGCLSAKDADKKAAVAQFAKDIKAANSSYNTSRNKAMDAYYKKVGKKATDKAKAIKGSLAITRDKDIKEAKKDYNKDVENAVNTYYGINGPTSKKGKVSGIFEKVTKSGTVANITINTSGKKPSKIEWYKNDFNQASKLSTTEKAVIDAQTIVGYYQYGWNFSGDLSTKEQTIKIKAKVFDASGNPKVVKSKDGKEAFINIVVPKK